MSFQKLTVYQLIDMLEAYRFTRKITELQLHHTYIPNHNTFYKAQQNGKDAHIYLQQAMKNAHVNKGWGNIGQHVTLCPDGIFVTGRDFNSIPISIKGRNTIGFAVEMLGDFDIGKDTLTGAQKEAILILIRYVMEIRKWNLTFHREYSSKTCPGTSINKDLLIKDAKGWKKPVEENTLLKVSTNQDIKFVDYHMVNGKYYVSLREVLNALGYSDIQADTVAKNVVAKK